MFKVGDILKLITVPTERHWYGGYPSNISVADRTEVWLQYGARVTISGYKPVTKMLPYGVYGFKGIRKGDPQWVDYTVESEFILDIKSMRKQKLNKICLDQEIE